MKKTLILPFLFIFFACSIADSQKDIVPIISFEGQKLPVSKDAIDCRFIKLETTSDNIIGTVNQVEIIDKRIFILDNSFGKKLLAFDTEGQFLHQIGKPGNGPGEYIYPIKFFINKNDQKIILVDGRRNRFNYYDLNTYQYISSKAIPFNFSDLVFRKDGSIVWFLYTGIKGQHDRTKYHVKITDKDFNDLTFLYPANFTSPYMQTMGSPLTELKDRLYVHHTYFPTIYEITQDNLLKTIYEIAVPPHHFVTEEYIKELEEKEGEKYCNTIFESDYVSAYSFQESSTHINITYTANKKPYLGFYDKTAKTSCKYTKTGLLPPFLPMD